jgi:hypothetical protein
MKDPFLERFREKPRPEFSRQLYQKLEEQSRTRGSGPNPLRNKRFVQGITSLSIVFLLTLAILPSVLAGPVRANLHTLPGLTFREMDRAPVTLSANTNPWIKKAQLASLQDARRTAGFPIETPSWTPENLVMQSSVSMVGVLNDKQVDRTAVPGKEIYFEPYAVGITWRDPITPRRIQLWVVKHGVWFDGLPLTSIGRGSFQPIFINLCAGALIQGQWNPQTNRWDNAHGGYLVWVEPDLDYYLVVTNGSFPTEDLKRMALAIK